MSVRPGMSVLLDERRELVAGKRIGVFTNHTGVLPDLSSSVDALQQVANVAAIFSPEHGLYGIAAAGEHVSGSTHRSGAPIYSLYGNNFAPTNEQLEPGGRPLDLIVCDIQDIGCRFYTYAWTIVKLLEVAAKSQIRVIIADRPNPLGGEADGPDLTDAYRSLVGLHNVPVRHGLTLGELATLVNHEQSLGCDLLVVRCEGWSRNLRWSTTGLPWVPPSPNIPTADTTLLYPGTCLLEGVNVSVGRGTAKPFEWLGAPWIDAEQLADELNQERLPGLRWRPVYFQPLVEPYVGQTCGGVQPHVIQSDSLEAVAAGIALAQAIRRLHPAEFTWNVAHFDRLAGSDQLRTQIEGDASLNDITNLWQDSLERFRARSASALLYETA
jgi:uncharacterized protein YbbC (DUF1343 family)